MLGMTLYCRCHRDHWVPGEHRCSETDTWFQVSNQKLWVQMGAHIWNEIL